METSTVRSVRVQMNADVAKYIADMRLAGAETRKAFDGAGAKALTRDLAATEKQIGSTNRRLTDTSTKMRQVDRDTQQVSRSLQQGGNSLNQYTGRVGALVKTIALVGPAAVPISAVAIPAIAGLSAGLGAAAGAAGVFMLAFNGIGDAVKAVDAYQLQPTTANLEKMHAALAKIGPDGRHFVQILDAIEPQLRSLQNTARAGLLPGVENGLAHTLTLLPQVRTFVAGLSSELGDLASDAGRSLADDSDWQKFFTYLQRDGGPLLDAFARSTGNVAAALASLLRDFGPLERDFANGLEDGTEKLRKWADGLEDTKGFHDFLDYIHDETPEVLGLLKALAEAVVALAQAAAPWGSVMLPVLTDVLQLFTAIAASPLGPVLVEAAAGMAAFKLASSFLGLGGKGGLVGQVGALSGSFRGLSADIKTVTAATVDLTAAERAFNVEGSAAASAQVFEKQFARQQLLSKTLTGFAPIAGIGGTILLANGIGQKSAGKAALENISGGALLGASIGTSIAPGVGTAVGAGIGALSGALITLATHMHDTSDAVKSVTVDWGDLASTLDKAGKATAQTKVTAGQALLNSGLLNAANAAGISDTSAISAATGSKVSMESLLSASRAKQAQLEAQAAALKNRYATAPDEALGTADAARDAAQLASLQKQIQAQKDLQSNVSRAASTLGDEASAQKRLDAATASATLSIHDQIAAQKALHQQALADFDAVTAFGQAVQDAAAQAKSGEKGLNQYTKAGADNRAALSGMISAYNGQSDAVKNNVRDYQAAKAKLVEFGRQMGLTKSQLADLTAQIDKPRRLVVQAETHAALAAIAQVRASLASLRDKRISVDVQHTEIFGSTGRGGPQFADGGYTGPGGKYEPAGIVHRREFVFSSEATQGNEAMLDSLHRNLRGYANGGLVGGNFHYDISSTQASTSSSSKSKDAETKAEEKATKAHNENLAAIKKVTASLIDLHKTIDPKEAKKAKSLLSSLNKAHLLDNSFGQLDRTGSRWDGWTAAEIKTIAAAEKATIALNKMEVSTLKQVKAYDRAADKAVTREKAALDVANAHKQAIVDDMAAIKAEIAARYQSNVFGNVDPTSIAYQIDPKTGKYVDAAQSSKLQVQGVLDGLSKDIANAQAAKSAESSITASLKKQGMSKDDIDAALLYLAQNASVEQMKTLASNPALAGQYATLYTQRQAASLGTGGAIAQQVDAQALAAATRTADAVKKSYDHAVERAKKADARAQKLDAENSKLRTYIKDHLADDTGKKVGDEINTPAKKGK